MPNKTQVPNHKQAELTAVGFSRVERDDRLLDVFTKETPEKGVELWEKWNEETVEIIRIHNGKQQQFSVSRLELEKALTTNIQLQLS